MARLGLGGARAPATHLTACAVAALVACGHVAHESQPASAGSGSDVSGAAGAAAGSADLGGASSSAGAATAGALEVAGNGGSADNGGSSASAGAAGAVEPTPPHPYRALQIAAGRDHTCALLEDHRVKCWGFNSYGQLGYGDTLFRGFDPAQMGDALPFVDLGTGRSAKLIAAGRYSTCAILDDDRAKCWGLPVIAPFTTGITHFIGDEPGEMGDHLPPLPLGPGHTVKAVAIGYYQSCVVRDDEAFFCGADSNGTLSPAAPDAHVVAVAADTTVFALYDDGSVRRVLAGMSTSPTLFSQLQGPVVAMAGSRNSSCFYLQGRDLQCLGQDFSGSLFQLPSGLPELHSMAISEQSVLCVVVADGHVDCWGNLSMPTWSKPLGPGYLEISLAAPALQLAAGDAFHCALLTTGAVECWGWYTDPIEAVGSNDPTLLTPVDLGTWHAP